MKLEELYPALQKRYPIEQEKKAVAEKKFKEDLKKEILTIIHYAKNAIEKDYERTYQAYEKIIDELLQKGVKQEELINENAFISIHIHGDCIDYGMHIRYGNVPIGRLVSEHNICDDLENLLKNSYYYENKEKNVVHFNSYLLFDLTDNTIILKFSAKPTAAGGYKEEEKASIKKFISDLEEIFPYSEEFPKFDNYRSELDLVLKFEYFESEYDALGNATELHDEITILNKNISEFNFSTRAINALFTNNINTIGDLVQLSEKELKHIDGIGYKTFNEIKYKLQEIDLSLLP